MKELVKYLYEIGQLKRVQRSGWWIAGIKHPETVAEHSFRTAVIAYILAHLEGADPDKSLAMSLFHDTAEARVNDIHAVARRYINWQNVEQKTINEQVTRLPAEVADKISRLFAELEELSTIEAKVVHDADALECLIQAREYQSQGFANVGDWIRNCQNVLITTSGKNIAQACLGTEPSEWWAI